MRFAWRWLTLIVNLCIQLFTLLMTLSHHRKTNLDPDLTLKPARLSRRAVRDERRALPGGNLPVAAAAIGVSSAYLGLCHATLSAFCASCPFCSRILGAVAQDRTDVLILDEDDALRGYYDASVGSSIRRASCVWAAGDKLIVSPTSPKGRRQRLAPVAVGAGGNWIVFVRVSFNSAVLRIHESGAPCQFAAPSPPPTSADRPGKQTS